MMVYLSASVMRKQSTFSPAIKTACVSEISDKFFILLRAKIGL